jgi:hypothetical protein
MEAFMISLVSAWHPLIEGFRRLRNGWSAGQYQVDRLSLQAIARLNSGWSPHGTVRTRSETGEILMKSTIHRSLTAALSQCLAIAALTTLSLAAQAQSAGIAPEAKQILKASTDFLASQQRFSADTRNTLEVVLTSGQKIEFNSTARQSVQRPNKLRAERTGDLVEQVFVYDGKSLTLYEPKRQVYAQVAAPGALEDMMDFARTKLDIVAPAGDLVYKNAYDILMDGVTEGIVVGKAVIEGVLCDHLAFRAPQTDWQIWIQEGAQPLPRKIVITTLDLPNAPQFSVTVTKWNLQPTFDAKTFTFVPQAGMKQIDFVQR